jgi:F0F1-type ATP synthase assembly protein I
MDTKNNQKSGLFYAISLASQLGFMIAIPLVGFLFLGLYIDKKLNTLPIFLISSIVLSIVFIPLEIRYLLMPFLDKKVVKKDKNNQ